MKYLEFKEKGEKEAEEAKENNKKLDQPDKWKDEWKAYAEEQGWPTEAPDNPKEEFQFYNLSDSLTIHIPQYIYGGIVLPFGILFLIIFIRASRRWIEMNETGIRTSWGREFAFEQIVSLNKKQWRKKGIAKIYFDDNDRKRRVVLDDCKYDVEPTKAILVEVESRIGHDKITGGPPETVEQTEPQAEEQAKQSAE
ncbi:MAG: hypothetical protein JXM70_14815 [Pirellulales bacterium]|nr:hypothetical protein [Pirellulales bacterium]